MSHFIEDLMRIGPAPTLRRETVMLVTNLLLAGAALGFVVATRGGLETSGLILLGVLVIGVTLRWLTVLVRTTRQGDR